MKAKLNYSRALRISVMLMTGLLSMPRAYGGAAHCPNYVPGKMNVYWGDLHSHSSYSFDAYAGGTRTDPAASYAFAKGVPITLAGGSSLTIDRPLDFLAPTDHSEFLGVFDFCTTQRTNPAYYSEGCQAARAAAKALSTFNIQIPELDGPLVALAPYLFQACRLMPFLCRSSHASSPLVTGPWQLIQKAAADANSPCKFTSFNGYEYSLGQGEGRVTTLHRNVIFASDRVPAYPYDSFTYPTVEQLWGALDRTCTPQNGCDVLSIPHNSNLSSGQAFHVEQLSTVGIKLKAKYERLIEIFQGKGGSECLNPSADDKNPDCLFEVYPSDGGTTAPDTSDPDVWALIRSGYVREGLKKGLKYYAANRINPLAVGFVGATDNHNGAPGAVAEDRWKGNHATVDDTVKERAAYPVPYFNPGGLTGVWAEENTRESLFQALKARRTYATSGPRMTVKVYQTWNQGGDPCLDGGFPGASDVPMGGDMKPPPVAGYKPRYVISALKDKTNLARVDIIKASLDGGGNPVEKVISLPASNPAAGDSALCRTFVDKDFDPKQPGFVYARVVEMPTYRWSHYDCVASPAHCDPSANVTIQERAWTSPIWNLP